MKKFSVSVLRRVMGILECDMLISGKQVFVCRDVM